MPVRFAEREKVLFRADADKQFRNEGHGEILRCDGRL
jgi:hypothetical protein